MAAQNIFQMAGLGSWQVIVAVLIILYIYLWFYDKDRALAITLFIFKVIWALLQAVWRILYGFINWITRLFH